MTNRTILSSTFALGLLCAAANTAAKIPTAPLALGSEASATALAELKAEGLPDPGQNPQTLNAHGYKALYADGDIERAIRIFRWNLVLFADQPTAAADLNDSLAEGYVIAGDRAQAIHYYGQALAIMPNIPSDPDAASRLARLKADAKNLGILQDELSAAWRVSVRGESK